MSETTEMSVASLLELVEPMFDLRRAFDLALSPVGRPDDDEDDDDTDDEDDDTSGDDTDDEDFNRKDRVNDPERQRLSREAAKYRNRAKEERKQREELEHRLKELEDKDNDDELAKTRRDLEEAQEASSKATAELGATLLRAAFAEGQLEHGRFKDQDYGLFLLGKNEDIEVEDGEVIGMDDWLKDLAERKPELFVSSGDDTGDEDEEDDERSDSGKTSSRKKKKGLDEQALKDKFPALANR